MRSQAVLPVGLVVIWVRVDRGGSHTEETCDEGCGAKPWERKDSLQRALREMEQSQGARIIVEGELKLSCRQQPKYLQGSSYHCGGNRNLIGEF